MADLGRVVLFKQHVVTAHGSHFAGGKHAFLCMASTLASRGYDVHVVSAASRAKVLVHAGMAGLLPLLSFGSPGVVSWRTGGLHHHVVLSDAEPAASTGPTPGLATAVSACVRRLVAHCGTGRPAEGPMLHPETATASTGSPCVHADSAARPPGGNAWVIIDADESQKPLGPRTYPMSASDAAYTAAPTCALSPPGDAAVVTEAAGAGVTGRSAADGATAAAAAAAETTLFEAVLSAAPPGRCLALVQNVHFLPLGPSGTGPRSAPLLGAWFRLGGIVAVSHFVADYIRTHWPRIGDGGAAAAAAAAAAGDAGGGTPTDSSAVGRPRDASGAGAHGADGRPLLQRIGQSAGAGGAVALECPGQEQQTPGHCQGCEGRWRVPPIRVVPLATWGVFGSPPFPDLAAAARPLLRAWRDAQAAPTLQPGTTAPRGADPVHVEPAEGKRRSPADQVPPPPPPPAQQQQQQRCNAEPAAGDTQQKGRRLPEQQQQQPRPSAPVLAQREPPPQVVVAVLKLTPEKGCSIVVELARRLAGRVRFRVVAGDPAVASVLAPLTAAGARATSTGTGSAPASASASTAPASSSPATDTSDAAVEVWEPQADVSTVLDGCVALLAPSLWLESWGMVVTEALLRGLPALVSDLGGLPEAGMHVCPAVPVAAIQVPLDAGGTPDWSARVYPHPSQQHLDAWERSLLGLLRGDLRGLPPAAGSPWERPVSSTAARDGSGDESGSGGSARGDGANGGGGGDGCAGGAKEEGDAWESVSRRGRQAATAHVAGASGYLEDFVAWLASI